MNKGMLSVGIILLSVIALLLLNVLSNYSTGGELDYYLVKETTTDTPDEPTVTNLYPNQETSTTSDGFTITFTGRNVTIDGSNDTGSIQCQTNQFDGYNRLQSLQLVSQAFSFQV